MERYDQSMADVLQSTMRDARDLLRGEIALAQAELRVELGRMRAAAILLAAAAVSAVIAVVFLLTAAAWAIAALAGWPAWTGFALVGALVLIDAVGLGLAGRRYVNGRRHMPHTVATMKENIEWMRARTS